jgi:hypothetical protein
MRALLDAPTPQVLLNLVTSYLKTADKEMSAPLERLLSMLSNYLSALNLPVKDVPANQLAQAQLQLSLTVVSLSLLFFSIPSVFVELGVALFSFSLFLIVSCFCGLGLAGTTG